MACKGPTHFEPVALLTTRALECGNERSNANLRSGHYSDVAGVTYGTASVWSMADSARRKSNCFIRLADCQKTYYIHSQRLE